MHSVDAGELEAKLGWIDSRRAWKPTGSLRGNQHVPAAANCSSRDVLGDWIGGGYAQAALLPVGRSTRGERRVVKGARRAHQGGGPSAIRACLRYVQCDGVAREDEPDGLCEAGTAPKASSSPNATKDDRRQFWFMVAPDDGAELSDLKHFIHGRMQ